LLKITKSINDASELSSLGGFMIVRLEEISSNDVENVKDFIVFWPIGVLESHGPHLPLGTDGFQVEYVVERLGKHLDIVLLPTLWYGNVEGLASYPGSISLRYETLKNIVIDVLESLWRSNFRKIVIVSGHAGSTHMSAIRHGAKEVVKRHPEMNVLVLSDYDFAYELRGKNVPEDDGHGGLIETSRVMDIKPELVHLDKVTKDNVFRYPRFLIIPDYRIYYKEGYRGYPTKANKELGKEINDYVIKRFLETLKEVFFL